MIAVVDTNVLLVANGQHEGMSPQSILECCRRLADLAQKGTVYIDDSYQIIREYQNKTNAKNGTGAGDVFLKSLLQTMANPSRCRQVHLSTTPQGEFTSFPNDPELANFDPPDKKFVAVARTSDVHPPILQAADSKWLGWEPALKRNGVSVEFLCLADIERFQRNKAKP